jgi:hypothetical protein
MKVYDRGCQYLDIARTLKIDKETVTDFRREVGLPNADAAREGLTHKEGGYSSLSCCNHSPLQFYNAMRYFKELE